MLSSILFLQLISSTTCFTLVPAAAHHPSSLYVRSLRKKTPAPPHHRDHHRHRTTPPTTILFLKEQQHQERELFRTFSIATPTAAAAAADIEGKVTNTVAYANRHHQFISSRLFILAAAAVVGTSASVFCHPMPANAAAGLSSDVSIVEKGQVIFDSTCAACHKGGGNVVAKERTLTQEALTKFLGPLENGSEDISTFVQNSSVHRGALVFSGRLTEEDYSNVAAYIYDQAMENKW